MAPKRLPPAEEAEEAEEDGNRSQIGKRWRGLLVQDVVAELQRLLPEELERVIRRVVPEVLKLLANHVQPASRLPINQDEEIKYRLHFQNKLPQEIFTFSRIVSADRMELQIAIMDSNLKEVITSNPWSSVKVEIVVVNGDFDGDGQKKWTEEEFKNKVVTQRGNRGPLLVGKLVIELNNGIGCLACANFTDNSSWTRSQKFRLAGRIFQSGNIEERVQEGISEPFRVKERRLESNQKHHPPLLTDEVWRLENIMRNGVLHKRLEKGGIHTVQQFLQAFTTDPEWLRTLLCDEVSKKGISNKRWDAIIAHAKECLIGDELCTYNVAGQNMGDFTASPQDLVMQMGDLPVGSIPTPTRTATAIIPVLLNPDYPAGHYDESAAHWGFQHPNQDLSDEQGFYQVQQPLSFQANSPDTADICYENAFRSMHTSGRDRNMPDESEAMFLEFRQPDFCGAAVPTSPRKWAKLIYGLKFWILMSKHIAARRPGVVHLECPNMVPPSCLHALGAGW